MISSFRCDETEQLFNRRHNRLPQRAWRTGLRKLRMLDSAVTIEDLRQPPGNRLEALKGDKSGRHSIRINNQYRICFIWREGNAHEVEIVDYH